MNTLNLKNFKPKKYDVIYSVNVFEHLLNWKLYLDKTKEWLKPNGINIILCPNYSFPRSHFKIPIILNKKITHIFKNKIDSSRKEKNPLVYGSFEFYKNERRKKLLY